MSGGCDRQKTDEEEIIEAHDVRLRRDRDDARQKEARATAALVAAREDLEKARAERDEARHDAERRIAEARDVASKGAVALAHAESVLRGEREAHARTRADREAAKRRIQLAAVAFDALRAVASSERTWIAGLPQWDALERALRGVAAVIQAPSSIEDRLAAVEARLAKLEGGAPEPVIDAPGYVPASGCAECGNDPGRLHGVACSQSNESRARRKTKSNPFEVREPPPWVPAFLDRFGARLTQGVDGLMPWVRADITLGTIEDAIGVLREHVDAYWTIAVEQKPPCAYCPRPCIGALSVCEEHGGR